MIGLDEVGRGAWAGPLVFAAVIFKEMPAFAPQLNDSKKLSAAKREQLELLIKQSAIFGIGIVEAEEIDRLGLTTASQQAILQALQGMPPSEIVIDGNINFLKGTSYEKLTQAIIGADASLPEAMAASILAKQERDRQMRAYDLIYPGFGFATHVGYGTKQHIESIAKNGLTPLHRRSYRPIQKFL